MTMRLENIRLGPRGEAHTLRLFGGYKRPLMSSYAVIDELHCTLDWSLKENVAQDTYVFAKCRLEEEGKLSNRQIHVLIKYKPRPFHPKSLHQTGITIVQKHVAKLRQQVLEDMLELNSPISGHDLESARGTFEICMVTDFRLRTLGQTVPPFDSRSDLSESSNAITGYFDYESEQFAPHQPTQAPAVISFNAPSGKTTLPKYHLSD